MAMKSDQKLIIGTTLIAVLAGVAPLGIKWTQGIGPRARQQETRLLLSRPPAHATKELRQALFACTEIRVWLKVNERCRPHTSGSVSNISPAKYRKPTLVLRGSQAQNLIAGLHAESHAPSAWRPAPQPYRGIMHDATVLDFYARNKWIAQIRFYRDYPGVSLDPLHQSGYIRWYTPLQYKGDSPLLPASERYLHRIIGK